ncbi:MAG: hypothetical protein GXP55_14070 [Deltaproteobacteria bacterium]|nr:hypothetical protein [Deltaproteobacteria bacterium]
MLIHRATLQVLAELGRCDSSVAASVRRQAYAALDPLIRTAARRRVVRAVASALSETESANDEGHVHRLAFLRLRRVKELSVDDVGELRERFVATPAPAPGAITAWLPRLLALLAVPLLALILYLGKRPPESVDPFATAVTTAGAYAGGGRPTPPTEGQRRVLREDLGDYLVALDALAADALPPASATARLDHARVRLTRDSDLAFGPDTSSFLYALLDQSEAITLEGNLAIDSHTRAADAFAAELASRGLGLYLDTDVWQMAGRRRVIMSSFEVEHVSVYRSGRARITALLLRRIDRLVHRAGVLGYTRPATRDALVLAAPIEGNLVADVLPSLGDDESYPMVDPGTRAGGEPWVAELESAAARTLRSALGDSLPSARDVRPLAQLFERRRAIFDAVARRVEGRVRVHPPRSYRFDADEMGGLSGITLNSERSELARIEAGLEEPAAREVWAQLFSVYVASVERHEVQHRLDFLADARDHSAASRYEVRGLSERAGRELSAYLAQMARDGDLAPSTLTLLANHVFDRHAPHGAYRMAAYVALMGLAEELPAPDGAAHSPRPGREELARIYLRLLDGPPARLANAARRLWERLFRRQLPPLERVGG